MSAYDPDQVFVNPGRLIVNPLSLMAPPNYGGTPLGYVSAIKVVREEETQAIMSEARGKRVGVIRGYTSLALVFVLIQYDKDVLNKLWAFTQVSGGGFTGANTLREPDPSGSLKPGVIPDSQVLLFAADDLTQPSALIYSPIWTNGARKELDRSLQKPLEEAVVVVMGEDAQGRQFAGDLIENLSL